jgi:hypothetical protein
MAADIINLKRARKAKDRAGKAKVAAENRVRFGRTKAERTEGEAARTLELRRLEGHRREGDPEDGSSGAS